jgi:formylglycine-generating enzyme required for sulfatase activity
MLFRLYQTAMAAGITRSGASGSCTYSPVPDKAQHPVAHVSFWNAARFANWLHNGQPTGPQNATSTEDGAYTITPTGIVGNSIVRNAPARWAITSENEWYKAACYQPAAQGGDADGYWLYGTSSNTISPLQANYLSSVLLGAVGMASYAPNFSGAFDMSGNVWEWNESIFASVNGSVRGVRGGIYGNIESPLTSDYRSPGRRPSDDTNASVGFRVVQIPSPGVCAVFASGVIGALSGSSRRTRTARSR